MTYTKGLNRALQSKGSSVSDLHKLAKEKPDNKHSVPKPLRRMGHWSVRAARLPPPPKGRRKPPCLHLNTHPHPRGHPTHPCGGRAPPGRVCSTLVSCSVPDKDSTRKGTLSLIKLELKSHLVKCLRVFVFITSKKLTCGSEFCFPVESEKPCVKTHKLVCSYQLFL